MAQDTLADDRIDAKKRFDVLLEALKDAYKELIDTNIKISGFLLIVLGWFASNKNPLMILCQSNLLTYAALTFVVVGFFLLAYLFWMLYAHAAELFSTLSESRYETILFKRFAVTKQMLGCGIFGQFTMLLGIFSVIYYKYLIGHETTCVIV